MRSPACPRTRPQVILALCCASGKAWARATRPHTRACHTSRAGDQAKVSEFTPEDRRHMQQVILNCSTPLAAGGLDLMRTPVGPAPRHPRSAGEGHGQQGGGGACRAGWASQRRVQPRPPFRSKGCLGASCWVPAVESDQPRTPVFLGLCGGCLAAGHCTAAGAPGPAPRAAECRVAHGRPRGHGSRCVCAGAWAGTHRRWAQALCAAGTAECACALLVHRSAPTVRARVHCCRRPRAHPHGQGRSGAC